MVFVPKTRPPYPDESRREALELLRASRSPRELAEALGVSEQTLRKLAPPGPARSPRSRGKIPAGLRTRTARRGRMPQRASLESVWPARARPLSLSMRLGSRTTAPPVTLDPAAFAWKERSCEHDRVRRDPAADACRAGATAPVGEEPPLRPRMRPRA